MYQKGDYVVYGANGTCKVEDVTRLSIPGCDRKRKYYVLRPVNTDKSTIYSPVDNEKVTIRDVISRKAVEEMIADVPMPACIEIPNEKQREEIYKEILRCADFRKCLGLVRTLLEKRREREEQGRKFTAVDERYLHETMSMIETELSVVMGIAKKEAEILLSKQILKE